MNEPCSLPVFLTSMVRLLFFFFFLVFLGPCPEHMEVSRLGVELELRLLATPNPYPLSEVRDRTHIFMGISGVHYL